MHAYKNSSKMHEDKREGNTHRRIMQNLHSSASHAEMHTTSKQLQSCLGLLLGCKDSQYDAYSVLNLFKHLLESDCAILRTPLHGFVQISHCSTLTNTGNPVTVSGPATELISHDREQNS